MRPCSVYRTASFCILVLLPILLLPEWASAQKNETSRDSTVRIVLADGSSVVGVIRSENDTTVVVDARSGVQMTIPRDKIESIESLSGRTYSRTDPNRSRLFFAPTSRPLPAGGGYLAVYEIFAPFVAIGAADVLTFAGGITLNPGSGRFAYAAPKITLMNSSAGGLAVGALAVTGMGTIDDATAGLFFGVGTLGTSEAALTLGMAYGWSQGKVGDHPVFMVGGELQTSDNVKLISENYIFPGTSDHVLFSGGLRFFGDQLAADLGLFSSSSLLGNAEGFPFFPWVGFAYNFGR